MEILCVKHRGLWMMGRLIDQGPLGATVRISRREVVQVSWADTGPANPNRERDDHVRELV
jgi:hypothetical protein